MRLAFGLLTILPVRARADADGLGASAPWFPLVGALIGAGAAGIRHATDGELGTALASVLATLWLVVITGALHIDGLADCADAIGVRGDRERRLSVMREPTIGTFGTLAVVFYALLLSAGIAGLDDDDALWVLVAVGAVSRWSALMHTTCARPARRDGLGAAFAVSRIALGVGTVLAAAAVIPVGVSGVAALVAGCLLGMATAAYATRVLGGRTGDTLGATISLAEMLALLVLLSL